MGYIQILLAGLHPLQMEDVRLQLDDRYDLTVAKDLKGLISTARRTRPDALVLDLPVISRTGLETLRRLKAALHQTKIIVVSWRTDPSFIIGAFRSGASAYVAKPTALAELPCAIETALHGQRYLSSSASARHASTVLGRPRPMASQRPTQQSTSIDKDMLRLIGRGHSAKRIAETRSLSVETVREYIAHLMKELGTSAHYS
jgi:DNA-binding NarL/FixJ family response regulator